MVLNEIIHMTALITDDNTMASALISRLTSEVSDLQIICKHCSPNEAYNHIEQTIGSSISINTTLLNEAERGQHRNWVDKVFVFITPQQMVGNIKKCSQGLQVSESSPYYGHSPHNKYLEASNTALPHPSNNDCIFIRDNSIIRRLNTADILYLEAMGDYVKFHTDKKIYTIHCTLKSAENRLPALKFLRVHRSFIIALNKLDSVQDGGLIIRERFIPVADNYRKILHQRMNVL
jgi:hypothetical protein